MRPDQTHTAALYPAVKITVITAVFIMLVRFSNLPYYFFPDSPVIFSCAALALCLLAIHFYSSKNRLAFSLFLLAVFLLVCARYPSRNFPVDHISYYTDLGRTVGLRGYVSRDPEKTLERTRWVFEVTSLRLSKNMTMHVHGRLLITAKGPVPVSYGEELDLYGMIVKPRGERNPGEFDYASYLANQNVFGLMHVRDSSDWTATGRSYANPLIRHFILPIKHHVMRINHETLSPLGASIATGLLVGERSEIPSEVLQAFSYTGTIHILSLSGLHVVFVSALLLGLFGFFRVPYVARVYLTLACLVVYIAVADFVPSVVRAAVMTGAVLLGTVLQRRRLLVNNLFVALLIIIISDPLSLFDIGLQLSFTAVLSIVIIYPKLETLCKRFGLFLGPHRSFSENIVSLLLVSVAAQIGTIPFTAYYFNKIPLIALAANVLIVPLSSGVMGLGFLSSLSGLFSSTAAQWYANVNDAAIWLMVKIAEVAAKLPFAYLEFYQMTVWSMLAFYLLIFYFLLWNALPVRKYGFMAGLIITAVLIWKPIVWNDSKLRIYFLDVGQGDATVVQLPDKKILLIDAGDRNAHGDEGEKVVAPFLRKIGIQKIDWLVMTHPHDDHIGGVNYLLKHFDVAAIIEPGQFYRSDICDTVLQTMAEKNIPRQTIRSGDALAIDREVALYCLHPSDEFVSATAPAPFNTNNASVVLKLEYRDVQVLFMGDAEIESDAKIARYGNFLQSAIVKVAHHGSWNGTSNEFISLVQPRYAVVSCGEFNKFNHPSPAVMKNLSSLSEEVFRTDRHGAVIFATDGKQIESVR
jgi:competence protein ComEC